MSTDNEKDDFGIRQVTKLTGTDNFSIWQRGLINHLRQKDAHRVLTGKETEPYRNPDAAKPEGEVAGDSPPGAAVDNETPTSTTAAALTAAQYTKWKEWERKEAKARSAIILTVSPGIAAELDTVWSSADIYTQLCTEHRIDSTERRADLAQRLQLMRLPAGATRKQMLDHYEQFTTMIAEATAAKMTMEEWDKCERFLFTIPSDMDTLRIQWRVLSADRRKWRELVSLYKIIADERGLTTDREAMVNAIFNHPSGKAKGNGKAGGDGGGGNRGAGNKGKKGGAKGKGGKGSGGNGGNKGDGDKKGKGGDKGDVKCGYCGYRNHTESDCYRKQNGEPSASEIKAAVAKIKADKDKSGNASVLEGDAASAVFGQVCALSAVPDNEPVGSVNATIFMAAHNDNEILIDSGATHHIVPNDSGLVNVTTLDKPLRFSLAGSNMEIFARSKGMLAVSLSGGQSFGIKDIYIVSEARMCIFSYGLLAEAGWTLDYMGRKLTNGSRTLNVIVRNVLPYVTIDGLCKPQCNAIVAVTELPLPADVCSVLAREDSVLYNEHCRLGHIHPDRIIEMAEAGRIDADASELKADSFKLADCLTCNRQKGTNLPRSGTSTRGTKDGEMIHVDIAGPFEPSSEGNIYYLCVVADYTRARQVIPIKLKSDAFQFVIAFIRLLSHQSGISVKVVRSDGGAEFGAGDNGSSVAKSFYTDNGIIHQHSPRYTPELNGVAERFNRTIKEMISSMVESTPLGHRYWDHAARYGCAILNMTTYNDDEKSAWSLLTGREPDVNKVREFGELVTAMIPSEIRKKSNFEQPRAELGRIVGMPPMTSGYLIRFENTGEHIVCRDVRSANLPLSTPLKVSPRAPTQASQYAPQRLPLAVGAPPVSIDEIIRNAPASRQAKMLEQAKNPNTPVGWAAERARARQLEHESSAASERFGTPAPASSPEGTTAPRAGTPAPRGNTPAPAPLPEQTTVAFAEADEFLLQEAWKEAKESGDMTLMAAVAAMMVDVDVDIRQEDWLNEDEPPTIRKALSSPAHKEWRAAIQAELGNLESKGTWVECAVPKDRKPIACKWVLKRKRDANGQITKYKARLVAKGFSQQPGIDFEETYAPVGRLTTLRTMLAIVATLGLVCRQADIDGAYLNGKLDRAIYMKFPEGMTASKSCNTGLLLLKTLYGLKQSGREWWLVLGDKLVTLGYTRCQSDWGLYVKKDNIGRTTAMVLVYVDDLVAAAKTLPEVEGLFDALEKEWDLTRLGDVRDILGMQVRRDLAKNTLTITMGGYIDKLAEKFPIVGTVGKYSPLPTTDTPDGPLLASVTPYLEIVGSLQWIASASRPDVAYSASFLGRYSAAPTEAHYELGLRVIRYLVNTRDVGLELGGKEGSSLTAYVDSDWAGCTKTRRSTTGYVSYVFGSAVNWISRRQATVSASTMEAEYIAAAEASSDIVWLRNLLKEIGMSIDAPTVVRIDNQSAIRLANNPSTHARSKHIDIKHHILRERVDNGTIDLEYIESKKNRADILTKALNGPLHLAHTNGLRLVRTTSRAADGTINAVIAKPSLADRIRRSNPLKERIGVVSPTGPSAFEMRLDRNKPLADRIGGWKQGSNKEEGSVKKDKK